MFTISTAVRENVKLKLGMSGPSGAGKTYSALQLAYGIAGSWDRVAVVDTENGSALYYAGFGPWLHIPFDPERVNGAYKPENYIEVIRFAERQPGVDVLVIDSISHEWEGRGGCLDIVDRIDKGFAGWKSVTPRHNAFMDAMRHSRLHIIATMRSKQDYVMEQNAKGKMEPKKVGTKSIQREGADYDFGIVFDVQMNHHARSSKDRTGVFMPRGEFVVTPETGKELLAWAQSGAEPAPRDPAEAERDFLEGETAAAPIYDHEVGTDKIWLAGELQARQVIKDKWKAISDGLAGKPRAALEHVIATVVKET